VKSGVTVISGVAVRGNSVAVAVGGISVAVGDSVGVAEVGTTVAVVELTVRDAITFGGVGGEIGVQPTTNINNKHTTNLLFFIFSRFSNISYCAQKVMALIPLNIRLCKGHIN
jgi:hypothetical protein